MEDKLVRAGNEATVEHALLARARRAIASKRHEDLKPIVDWFLLTAATAKATDDSRLKTQCEKFAAQFTRIVKGASVPLLETKAAVARIRDAGPSDEENAVARGAAIGEIRGLGAAFNNVDYGGDIIAPGAFAKTLAQAKADRRLPRMLAQHDSGAFPVGSWTDMRETADGLEVTGLIADTPRGREAWSLINMQPSALDGLSIGYRTTEQDYDRAGNRVLKEIELFEVSLVASPMNTLARVFRPKQADSMTRALAGLRSAIDGNEDDARVLHFPNRHIEPDTSDDEAETAAALLRLARTIRG